jgi:hypothetical protein
MYPARACCPGVIITAGFNTDSQAPESARHRVVAITDGESSAMLLLLLIMPIADCADLTVVPTAGADWLSSGGVELCLVGTIRVEGADASSIG